MLLWSMDGNSEGSLMTILESHIRKKFLIPPRYKYCPIDENRHAFKLFDTSDIIVFIDTDQAFICGMGCFNDRGLMFYIKEWKGVF